jgi:hypothetical protein
MPAPSSSYAIARPWCGTCFSAPAGHRLLLIFSGPPKPLVQIGVVGELPATYAPLRAVPLLKIIPYDEASRGQLKVRHHQLDLLLSPAGGVTG